MRVVSATEARHHLAALLDAAERGETVVLTRGGCRNASMGPVGAGNGAAVRDLLVAASLDRGFAADVRAARSAVSVAFV